MGLILAVGMNNAERLDSFCCVILEDLRRVVSCLHLDKMYLLIWMEIGTWSQFAKEEKKSVRSFSAASMAWILIMRLRFLVIWFTITWLSYSTFLFFIFDNLNTIINIQAIRAVYYSSPFTLGIWTLVLKVWFWFSWKALEWIQVRCPCDLYL